MITFDKVKEWLPIINSTATLGLVWYASKVVTYVDEIRTNHLPHLQAGLNELRQDFINHLEHGSKP